MSFVGWMVRRSDDSPSISDTSTSITDARTAPSTPPLLSSSSSPPVSSSSYYPSITPSAPSESEIESMRAENLRLRAALEMIKNNKKPDGKAENIDGYSFEHLGTVPGANGFLLSIPSAPPACTVNSSLWIPLPSTTKPIPTNPFAVCSPSSSSVISSPSAPPSSLSTASPCLTKVDGEVLLTPDDSATVIMKSETEGEVALLDLSEIDWYVMVNSDGTTNDHSSSSSNDSSPGKYVAKIDRKGKYSGRSEDKIVDSEMKGDDEGYLLIDHDDYIIALSDFISRSIQKRFPEAEQIPPEQLTKILGTAFRPLKPPSKFGQLVGWANFLYASYSWGNTAFTIYKDGIYAKLVLRGAMKAAQWLLVLVL